MFRGASCWRLLLVVLVVLCTPATATPTTIGATNSILCRAAAFAFRGSPAGFGHLRTTTTRHLPLRSTTPSFGRRATSMTTMASGSGSASTTATGSSSSTSSTSSTSSGSNGSGGGGVGVGGVSKRLTLLFVRRTNPETGAKEVLLGMKKRGFGLGKWNGFGGKVEPGETVPAAALRELEEEACVTAAGAELRGKITFTFQTVPDVLKVHVFEAQGPITGEPQETDEMRPQWYAESAIPYDKMWADDQYWVPLFLEGKRFQALFEFDDESTILRYDLRALAPGEELACDE